MMRACSVCLVLLGLVFLPTLVSARQITGDSSSPITDGATVTAPEPATLLLMAPAVGMLLRARLKKK